MVTKQYDAATKTFVDASTPQVIGTKKKNREPVPVTPRAGGLTPSKSNINMKNFTKP